jgi:hypothetical protein
MLNLHRSVFMIFPSSAESMVFLPQLPKTKGKKFELVLCAYALHTVGFCFCNNVLQLVQSVFINPIMLTILIVNQTNSACILKK